LPFQALFLRFECLFWPLQAKNRCRKIRKPAGKNMFCLHCSTHTASRNFHVEGVHSPVCKISAFSQNWRSDLGTASFVHVVAFVAFIPHFLILPGRSGILNFKIQSKLPDDSTKNYFVLSDRFHRWMFF